MFFANEPKSPPLGRPGGTHPGQGTQVTLSSWYRTGAEDSKAVVTYEQKLPQGKEAGPALLFFYLLIYVVFILIFIMYVFIVIALIPPLS